MNLSLLETQVNATSYADVTVHVRDWAVAGQSRTISIANVHVLMEAHDSVDFREAVNSSDMVTPDGMPLVWMLRLKGVKGQARVYGPTLMLHVLEMASERQIPVGFYGADPTTLAVLVKNLQGRFPGLRVVYSFSPPFRPLDDQEAAQVMGEINASGLGILFVGLGCPKQERWMAQHRGRIHAVMLGVGAAFDFHAGSIPQAPAWMQSMGLEWWFRLLHEPRRLIHRYLYNNPRFVFLALADLLGMLHPGRKEA